MRSLPVSPLMVLAPCAALAAGCASSEPRVEGVGDYSGVEKEYAQAAIREAKPQDNEWGGPGPLITAYRVMDVRRCPRIPARCGPAIRVRKGVFRENPECEGNPFTVDVQTHTFFGAPWAMPTCPATDNAGPRRGGFREPPTGEVRGMSLPRTRANSRPCWYVTGWGGR